MKTVNLVQEMLEKEFQQIKDSQKFKNACDDHGGHGYATIFIGGRRRCRCTDCGYVNLDK